MKLFLQYSPSSVETFAHKTLKFTLPRKWLSLPAKQILTLFITQYNDNPPDSSLCKTLEEKDFVLLVPPTDAQAAMDKELGLRVLNLEEGMVSEYLEDKMILHGKFVETFVQLFDRLRLWLNNR